MRLLLISLLISYVTCFEYFKSVIVANDSNFHSLIYNKDMKYTLMNFYRTDCTHCNALGPQYTILADLYKNNSKVQIAQIEGKVNKKVRMKEKIMGFPCIRLYAFDGSHIASFVGERQADAMADWLVQNIGARPEYPDTTVERIETSEKGLEILKDGQKKLIAFITPWLDDWKHKVTQFEKSSWGHKNDDEDKVKFYQVDSTTEENAELMSLLKITQFPTLLYLNDDGSVRVGLDKEWTEHKFNWFIDDDNIGVSYSSFDEFTVDQASFDDEEEDLGKVRGFNQNHGKFDDVDDEELYKRLREL